MTEAIKLVTFINLVFVIMLMVSGSLSGVFGSVTYYLAFILPVAIGYYASVGLKYKREELKGIAEPMDEFIGFDKSRAIKLLPLITPIVFVVFLASLLFSFILSLVGVSAAPVEDTGIIRMLLVHALAPALFEEALFRYIPMKLLLPYSKRWCVIYSAFCFALIHCSFVQMPYAFIAGVIFMAVDVAFGSVWPSVILHLVNNAASVISMKYCTDITSTVIFIGTLALLSLLSLIFVFKNRIEYKQMLSGVFEKGESFRATYAPAMLILICGYAAFSAL